MEDVGPEPLDVGTTEVGSPSPITVVVVTVVVGSISMIEMVVGTAYVYVVGSAVTVNVLVIGGEDSVMVLMVGVWVEIRVCVSMTVTGGSFEVE